MPAQSSKRAVCRIEKVWGYPKTENNDGPIEFAFACRCGKGGIGFKDEGSARAAASRHFDAGRPS